MQRTKYEGSVSGSHTLILTSTLLDRYDHFLNYYYSSQKLELHGCY
jgi:hypothetical protein